MAGLKGIAIALVIFVVTQIASSVSGFPLVWIMIFATAGWAAWDSKRLELTKFKSGIALSPALLFVGIALLWIVGFPWYLAARFKIVDGTMPRKELGSAQG
jgi:hypothetical protein